MSDDDVNGEMMVIIHMMSDDNYEGAADLRLWIQLRIQPDSELHNRLIGHVKTPIEVR